ncbi:DUF456 domain-containing protein [Candidatus Parcubacteria bacterium]|nr:DUF456 domain-containing protein [Candidatus Parcubacteria bacterium]
MIHSIASIIAIALVIPGIFMAFVPMLPALSYMFVVALAFAVYDGFAALTVKGLLALLAITVVSIVTDHTSGLLGAKYGGAHTKSLLWGILGAFVGLFTLPALGSFIGLFAGVLLAEIYYKKHHGKALKAAGGALVGSVVGVGVNIVLSLIFAITFICLIV